MKISVYYEELVNMGNYENCRVGITVQSDTDLTKDKVAPGSNVLFDLAKQAIQDRVEKIKNERMNNAS